MRKRNGISWTQNGFNSVGHLDFPIFSVNQQGLLFVGSSKHAVESISFLFCRNVPQLWSIASVTNGVSCLCWYDLQNQG
jgi:hypothetical protein